MRPQQQSEHSFFTTFDCIILVPFNYHLFSNLKIVLGGLHFVTNFQQQKWKNSYFANIDADFYDTTIIYVVKKKKNKKKSFVR